MLYTYTERFEIYQLIQYILWKILTRIIRDAFDINNQYLKFSTQNNNLLS